MSAKAGTPKRFGPAFAGTELALLSFGSGCMDILSYQEFGEVFTSAMTGNTALLGMKLGQGNLVGIASNLMALVGFLLGLLGGFTLLRRQSAGLSNGVVRTLGTELVVLLAFSAAWIWAGGAHTDFARYGLIGLAAIAMGLQTAAANAIDLAGISTTFFTGTLTRLVSGVVGRTLPQEHELGSARQQIRWPLIAIAAYILGAAATGFLDARGRVLPPIALTALPLVTVAIVLLMALARSRRG